MKIPILVRHIHPFEIKLFCQANFQQKMKQGVAPTPEEICVL